MERRPFGPTARDVSVIGQGTWYLERADRATAIAAVHRAIDLGITHIDTAELYGSGAVETLLGEALVGRREQVVLVSKVLPQNASRRGTTVACERSLERLRTSFLDCYLLHWPGQHPLEDTIAAFEELTRAGKIRSWGVSNFDIEQLEAALRIAGPGRIACNQVLYHLKQRAIEHEVLPWCQAHEVAVVGYSPFGSGRFPGPRTPGGRVLEEIAGAHQATARQVALRFLVRHPSAFAIPKASSPEHVEDNARAGSLPLTESDLHRIDQAFPLGKRSRELPTL